MAASVPTSGRPSEKDEASKPKRTPKPMRDLTEPERLVAHRVLGLLDLHFSVEQALGLCHTADIVHEAEELLKRGWPHSYVYEELT